MEKSSAFIVQFSGLKLGKHNFEFVVDDTFFEKLDYSQVKHGEIEVNIELEKKIFHAYSQLQFERLAR
jgi:hypothetical protein